jgi:predicted MFS family arabinose efflux permease
MWLGPIRLFRLFGNHALSVQDGVCPTSATGHLLRDRRWGAVLLCLSSGIVAGMEMGKAAAGMVGIRSEFGIGLETAAWIASVFAIPGAAGAIFFGHFTQRVGSRAALAGGMVALTAGGLVSLLSDSFAFVLLGRAVEGAGFLTVNVAAPSLLHRYAAEKDRRLAMVLWSACMPAGIALMLLCNWAAPGSFGWRGLWWLGGCVALVITALVIAILPPGDGPPSRHGAVADLSLVLRTKCLLFPMLAGCYMFLFSVIVLFPTMFVDCFGMGVATASALAAPVVMSGLAGGVIIRHLWSGGLSRSATLFYCAPLMGGAALILFRASESFVLVYAMCLLFGACAGILAATTFDGATATAPSPRLVPVVMGLVMQVANMGLLAGPVIVGATVKQSGWHAAPQPLLFACGALVLIAILLQQLRRELPPAVIAVADAKADR